MLFSILTLFPDAVEAYLDTGVLGIARARGIVTIRVVDFRDFSRDRHRTVDDRPFGGGPGMVLKPEPIVEAVEWLEERHGAHRRIALTPDGATFDQRTAEAMAGIDSASGIEAVSGSTPVLLLCGRYEGFDERCLQLLEFERLSIGDYVLAGGELGALVVVEAVSRLLPGVLGDDRSAVQDSYSTAIGGGLDHPHYTRPRVFRGVSVPDVLLSGDHAAIDEWREKESSARTELKLGSKPATSGERIPESSTSSTERNG
ncbi:MAG: tRNA (guanosine(37)-N1)-methyltransferase TrmD [Planctomycetota bacterium]